MGREPKYSKKVKVKVCEDYIAGNVGFGSIAKSIGCKAKCNFRKRRLTYIK